ncbi:MAG: hypothetical protein V4563_17290 [Pseudomonadota bacterium]
MTKDAVGSLFKYLAARMKEPSTYAGLASIASGAATVASEAKHIAEVFKGEGPFAGVVAIAAGVVAFSAVEKSGVKDDKKGDVIDAEFTVVKEPGAATDDGKN